MINNDEHSAIYKKIISRFPADSEYLQPLKSEDLIDPSHGQIIDSCKRKFRSLLETQRNFEVTLRPMPQIFFEVFNTLKVDAAAVPLPTIKKV